MFKLFQKILLKSYRTLGLKKTVGIRDGILKGVKWSVSIPDSRYILGEYEVDLSRRVKGRVEQGQRFVDIGANASYFSLIAARYGNSTVEHIAVEPFPANVALLRKHFSENKVENVIVEELAISDQTGEISFSNSPNLAANTYKSESSVFGESVIKVKTTDLDTIAAKYGLDENVLIKIDVEGAELDVLKGGIGFLNNFHPDLVLATHDCHVPGVKDDCLKFLADLGYACKTLDDIKIDGQEDFLCTFNR